VGVDQPGEDPPADADRLGFAVGPFEAQMSADDPDVAFDFVGEQDPP
jgi:hypothetical protein